MNIHFSHLILPFLLSGLQLLAAEQAQPNIIVILTDDMGYSDLGCYGSEIETPHLDGLAQRGLRFSQFYNTGRCCPTRASLLTGLYAHQAGVGNMLRDEGPARPGYRGRLMDRCVTIAEVLGPAGYRCIQTGKWHLGDKNKDWWASGRGFDRVFGCPQGGGFYFRPSSFSMNREVVRGDEVVFNKQTDPPPGWYATDAYTDEGLAYVEEALADQKPFFWYLAYNAPHFPLQAKPADIAKYRGRYKAGWDVMRQQRYKRLVELGLIRANWKLPPRDSKVPAWDSLSDAQQDQQDERMATYAAMIDCMDQNVGKIIATLEQHAVFDNTLILFLHDNGGAATGGVLGSNKGRGPVGSAESDVYYGTCWANVSDTPFRKYKMQIHEGGIASPLIAHWPNGIGATGAGRIASEPVHVIDVLPTCLAISGATYPATRKGTDVLPPEGRSLLPIFQDKAFKREAPLFFEHGGNRGLRHGDWKLVADKGKAWELYNMAADRTELTNMAAEHPEKVLELDHLYDAWAKRCLVTKANN